MKVLETGGAGFIGGNFVHHMVNKYPDYQSLQVSCIGQQVQVDNLVFRILVHHVVHKIASDKSGSAGNNDLHLISSKLKLPVVELIHVFSVKHVL